MQEVSRPTVFSLTSARNHADLLIKSLTHNQASTFFISRNVLDLTDFKTIETNEILKKT